MAGVYGPRPTDRREAFSEDGFLNVDVKLASFSTRVRGRIQQVRRYRYIRVVDLAVDLAVLLVGPTKAPLQPAPAESHNMLPRSSPLT